MSLCSQMEDIEMKALLHSTRRRLAGLALVLALLAAPALTGPDDPRPGLPLSQYTPLGACNGSGGGCGGG